jgi:hypothetical protein
MTTTTMKGKGRDSEERGNDIIRREGTDDDDDDEGEGEGTGQRRERG